MTGNQEKFTEDASKNELWLLFAEELIRREEMSDKDRLEEFNHLRHLSEYERFWKVCVRESKKNREEWLRDMHDEIYSEWVIYLVDQFAADDDYLRAMGLVLLGIPLTHSQAVSALEKLSEANLKGVVFELPDDVFEVRLEGMPAPSDVIGSFTLEE